MIESPINSVPMQRGQALSVELTTYSQHVLPCIHDLIADINFELFNNFCG